jgi:hypothetical protein
MVIALKHAFRLTVAGEAQVAPSRLGATMGLWFDHLRRGEVQLAYQYALEYRDPTFFWRGVMRASCLGLLGRTPEAAVTVADLLQRKPDFEARGRTLIGHYIKLDEVMSQVVDGLARAGLTLA